MEQQVFYPLFYDGEMAGACIADLVIEYKVGPELKSVEALSRPMNAQLLNFPRLSELNLGILVNFRNASLEWKRMILSN